MEVESRWQTRGELDRVIGGTDAALSAAGLGTGVRVASLLRNHR